jgi:manganese oxidase
MRWMSLPVTLAAATFLTLSGCATNGTSVEPRSEPDSASLPKGCAHLITAEVVALEQAIVLNRYGAFNPAGMLFALKRDVVVVEDDGRVAPLTDANMASAAGKVRLRADKRPRPIVLRVNEGDCLEVSLHNLLMPNVLEERTKGPEQTNGRVPLHMADSDSIIYPDKKGNTGRELVRYSASGGEWPRTRAASFQVNGLEYAQIPDDRCPASTENRQWVCSKGDAGNVGLNTSTVKQKVPAAKQEELRRNGLLAVPEQGSQAYPGQSAKYLYRAFREGTYFAYSTGATVGGEGDGGQLGLGLFGAVNVQPPGSRWYRSQVTHSELNAATVTHAGEAGRHPYREIDYDGATDSRGPILAMLNGKVGDKTREIIHSDINAVVMTDASRPDGGDTTLTDKPCDGYVQGNSCGKSYREFTVIMHDEVKAVQAFAELEDPGNPLHYVKDGMGINYGVGGMGAMVVARNRKVGPVKDCLECRAEEFFLSSWANGDPALVLKWGADGKKPTGAMYPDDPSNVHHSYLNDPVRFRNIHAGPKETHVFHLHAHQWVQDVSDAGSTYLDSQTISPGATFSYEINWGGSGNRNLSPGDSIFHCHLYPHFAQGMWELWRVHDVFEDGNAKRNYPDAEVAGGTENPALVPVPGTALPPMPTEKFAGYPFYVAGESGHRPPQPPLDMDEDTERGANQYVDGGLQRHVLVDKNSLNKTGINGENSSLSIHDRRPLVNQEVMEAALKKGGLTAQINAAKVYKQNPDALMLAEKWDALGAMKFLDPKGEASERAAMDFHEGKLSAAGLTPRTVPPQVAWSGESAKGYATDWAMPKGMAPKGGEAVFLVNGRAPQPGSPFADPCPASAPKRSYKAGVIQTELTVNKHGWFDPQARILALEQDIQNIIDPNTRDRLPEPLFFRANSGDCITFKHSNFLPNAMGLDDFQIYTPTDTVGQHIHLVKFDVTSSDGSGNGWNYEDGTYSPEEVRERVFARNRALKAAGVPANDWLKLKTHPLFVPECTSGSSEDITRCKNLRAQGTCPIDAHLMNEHKLNEKHPFCGAQRTVQRWWADPILDRKSGKDYTLRTVFTHDHFGPSTHQQHGLYAALVIEPTNSVWLQLSDNNVDWNKLCASDKNVSKLEAEKIIGGANLFNGSGSALAEQCQKFAGQNVKKDEMRPPFVNAARNDGGPTSSRANIISPRCIERFDTNPLDPQRKPTDAIQCASEEKETHQTRREFGVAFADFAILYNAALEPINPEERDVSALRFGARQVAINIPKPLAISSEDPGTQLINYRNEPVPLRIVDVKVKKTDPVNGIFDLGGFDFSQTRCASGDLKCTGDLANVFSSDAHESRDRKLATQDYRKLVNFEDPAAKSKSFLSPSTRGLLAGSPLASKLDTALADIERWRKDFNCALYSKEALPSNCRIETKEPWRVMGDPATPILPVYEGDDVQIRLVQGSQEAQHVFTMNGTKWLRQPNVKNSGYTNAQPLGISEHFEFDVKVSALNATKSDYMYFGSSIDQLWDGMWGLMRAYGRNAQTGVLEHAPDRDGKTATANTSSVARIRALSGQADTPPPLARTGTQDQQVCVLTGPNPDPVHSFDVSAVRVCQLVKNDVMVGTKNEINMDGVCRDPAKNKGLVYNERQKLADPNAIVYMLLRDQDGQATTSIGDNQEVLGQLQQQYADRQGMLEPLVLRAPAGACIKVTLRNLLWQERRDEMVIAAREPGLPKILRQEILDGPVKTDPVNDKGEDVLGHYADNFMSMIMDGFNYNQFRMSSSVSLSAPQVAQYIRSGDGSNVGTNAAKNDPQGSLVPACAKDTRKSGVGCTREYVWWAGDYQLEESGPLRGQRKTGKELELGALPLRSFGDVIKQPAHGAIGALVIGPKNSVVCKSADKNEIAADKMSDMSATICDAQKRPLYRDFVMVLQDAVDMKKDGWRLGNLKGAEEPDDYGAKAINYRSEPLWGRRGDDPSMEFEGRQEFDYANVLSSKREGKGCQAGIKALTQTGREPCDPETPVFVAKQGSEVRLRVVHPGGHTRQQGITVHGHKWNPYPWINNSTQMFAKADDAANASWTIQGTYNAIGPMMAANLIFKAGGSDGLLGDYLFRSQASFVFDGGIWGLLRVTP